MQNIRCDSIIIFFWAGFFVNDDISLNSHCIAIELVYHDRLENAVLMGPYIPEFWHDFNVMLHTKGNGFQWSCTPELQKSSEF